MAARSASSAAPDGLCPRGVMIAAARSGVQRRGQRLGPHPVIVHRDRREPQPERPRQVEHARPARVLDGQQVAGGELRREHALDPVERAVDHHDPLGGHAVGDERAARQRREVGVDGWLAVEPLGVGRTAAGPGGAAGRAAGSGAGAAGPGASAGSGLPSARSRVPARAADARRAREELRGGRSATRVPERGRETTTPRRRSSARADATVVGDTSRSPRACVPTEAAPRAPARPRRPPARPLAAMASADAPDMTYCADTELELYCNRC